GECVRSGERGTRRSALFGGGVFQPAGPFLDSARVRRSCRRVPDRNARSSPPNRRQPPAQCPALQATVVGDDRGLVPGLPARSRVADRSGLGRTPSPTNAGTVSIRRSEP